MGVQTELLQRCDIFFVALYSADSKEGRLAVGHIKMKPCAADHISSQLSLLLTTYSKILYLNCACQIVTLLFILHISKHREGVRHALAALAVSPPLMSLLLQLRRLTILLMFPFKRPSTRVRFYLRLAYKGFGVLSILRTLL
jgi:hypothetical protein